MGKESEQANPIVDKVEAVVSDDENHFIDWHLQGNADQRFSLLNESASSELLKQGMLPAVDVVADDGRSVLFGGSHTGADGLILVDDSDSNRYQDGTPKLAKSLESSQDGKQQVLAPHKELSAADTKPQFAGHPDLAGEDGLQVIPLSYKELSAADTKPQFAAPSDMAGDEQLAK